MMVANLASCAGGLWLSKDRERERESEGNETHRNVKSARTQHAVKRTRAKSRALCTVRRFVELSQRELKAGLYRDAHLVARYLLGWTSSQLKVGQKCSHFNQILAFSNSLLFDTNDRTLI